MKAIISLVLFLLSINLANADVVNLNTLGWTQEQKNMVHAMAVKILFNNSITYDSLSVNNGVIEVSNPTQSIVILTEANILAEYNTWKTASDIATAQAIAEQTAKDNEYKTNPLKNLTLAQIDALVDGDFDAATNLTQLRNVNKVYWKRIIKYLKAQE